MADPLRILVHTMQETESSLAETILGSGAVRRKETVVEGLADEKKIAQLRARNLLVEVLDEAEAAPVTPAGELFRASARLDWSRAAAGGLPRLPSGAVPALPSPGQIATYSLKLADPASDLMGILRPIGARVLRRLAQDYVVSRLVPRQRAALEADERIEVAPFNVSPAKMPSRELTDAERDTIAPSTGEKGEFDLIAHSPERRAEIVNWVQAKGAALTLVGESADRVRIRLSNTSPLLDEADQLDAVLDVRHVPPAYLCLDHARRLIGFPAAPAAQLLNGPTGPLDGAGEILGIIDGAVDTGHADFGGRVETIYGPATPFTAHGTHVAGIIVGDGKQSAGLFRGIAPAAKLKAHALATTASGLIDLDCDFAGMLERSYQAGVRILNLSFEERGAPSLYSDRSKDLDAFAVRRPDMLLVVAAGNQARTETAIYRNSGEVDIESISTLGVAKNALTVGASCSDRRGGGHPAANWSLYAPTRFQTGPTSLESLSGDDTMLAAFSGRGWSERERIKPDLVAPGTNIVAPRARGAADDPLWALYSPNPDYVYSGGTSMAAPVVAGCAALIRQYYRQRRHTTPSAALLKATLALGATWLGGSSATGSVPAVPSGVCANLDQGFGRVNVPKSLGLDRPGARLCYVDVTAGGSTAGTLSNGPALPLTDSLDRCRLWFECDSEGDVDIALCHLDPDPGAGSVALSLQVQPAGGERRAGNDLAIKNLYPRHGPVPDKINTLQLVRLGRISSKVEIQIQVLAAKSYKVGFALVVLGPVKNEVLHLY